MQKTRLGIAVGLLGAGIYLAGLFGGFLATVVMAGYVLLFEENLWLRGSALKAIAVVMFFSLLSSIVGLIPDAIDVINNIANIFNDYVQPRVLLAIVSAVRAIIDLIEKVLLLLLTFKAFNQGTVTIPVVDGLINKYLER